MTTTPPNFPTANAFAAFVIGSADGPETAYRLMIEGPTRFPGVHPSFWLAALELLSDDRAREVQVIDLACSAFDAAARLQFEADGSQDVGSCGGVMLGYRSNTRFAKALVATGQGYASGGKTYIRRGLPEGVRTQHRTVTEKAHAAFAAVAEVAGFLPTVNYSYAD